VNSTNPISAKRKGNKKRKKDKKQRKKEKGQPPRNKNSGYGLAPADDQM